VFVVGCGSHLTVEWSEPTSAVTTRGAVKLRVVISGGRPESVEFLDNGRPFVKVGSPYEYLWDTTSVPEGIHRLTAAATHQGTIDSSRELLVTIDRTPPTIVSRTPIPDAGNVGPVDPAVLRFSEDLDPASISTAQATFVSVAARIPTQATQGETARELVFNPLSELPERTGVRIELLGTVQDAVGNTRQLENEAWEFSTLGFLALATFPSPGDSPSLVSSGSDLFLSTLVGIQHWEGAGWGAQVLGSPPVAVSLEGALLTGNIADGGHVIQPLSVPDLVPGPASPPLPPDLSYQSRALLVSRTPVANPVVVFNGGTPRGRTSAAVRLEGLEWRQLAPLPTAWVAQLLDIDGNLYILGGAFFYGVFREAPDGGWDVLPDPPRSQDVVPDSPSSVGDIIADGDGGFLATTFDLLVDGGWMNGVSRWNGRAWSALGPPVLYPLVIRELHVDGHGQPWLLVYASLFTSSPTEVLRLSGGTWRVVGGVRNAALGSVSLGTTSDGRVWRLWVEEDGGVTLGQFGEP